jgi:hypothetical protein
MRSISIARALQRIETLAVAAALLAAVHGAGVCRAPRQDALLGVFEIRGEIERLSSIPYWPGFDPRTVPTAIFDSASTYLFDHPSPPEGFEPVEGKPGVHRFAGQHPAVSRNGRTRLGDVMTATSVLRERSRLGERYSTRDLAGIVIHEQFHVFQAAKHPSWRPNDAFLLVYPLETAESLYLRNVEKEAFRRAVASSDEKTAAGWAKEGLKYRARRLEPLGEQIAGYEMELQRFEGISEYIETLARGNDPLWLLAATSGIAPSGVRDLGYVEGRLISFLLDRLDTRWKERMESGEAQYPEELLAAAVAGVETSAGFGADELEKLRSDAETAIAGWNGEKKRLVSSFHAAPGLTIEIIAETTPLGVRMFEPLAMENLGGGEIFHKVFFSAANDKGAVRVRNTPCISYMDSTYRLTKVTITALPAKPEIDAAAGAFTYDAGGVSIDFKGAKVTPGDRRWTIEL